MTQIRDRHNFKLSELEVSPTITHKKNKTILRQDLDESAVLCDAEDDIARRSQVAVDRPTISLTDINGNSGMAADSSLHMH